MPINNPLRYPGAKSKLVPYIEKLIINENLIGCTFLEPYCGSAAVSFKLLEKGIVSHIKINELDPLIYNFWYSVMNYTDELINLIKTTDISIDTWRRISQYRNEKYLIDKSPVEIGFAGLFLNRTNFSGILKANPLGGMNQTSAYSIDCRFNKKRIIKSILDLSLFKDQIDIFNLDAISFMKQETRYKRNRSIFVYIDPPYYEKGPSLYRYFYNYDMHKELAKYIKLKAFPWLISYDNHEEIKKMYKRRFQQQIYLDYSVKTSIKGKELLISNLEIPPILNQEVFATDQLG